MRMPVYETPEGTVCPECGGPCTIVGDDNSFDYAGTHCTHGRSGTHYPSDWGKPVSDCCEAPMECETTYEPFCEADWEV